MRRRRGMNVSRSHAAYVGLPKKACMRAISASSARWKSRPLGRAFTVPVSTSIPFAVAATLAQPLRGWWPRRAGSHRRVGADAVAAARDPQQAGIVQQMQRARRRLGEAAPVVLRTFAPELRLEVGGMRHAALADEPQNVGGKA